MLDSDLYERKQFLNGLQFMTLQHFILYTTIISAALFFIDPQVALIIAIASIFATLIITVSDASGIKSLGIIVILFAALFIGIIKTESPLLTFMAALECTVISPVLWVHDEDTFKTSPLHLLPFVTTFVPVFVVFYYFKNIDNIQGITQWQWLVAGLILAGVAAYSYASRKFVYFPHYPAPIPVSPKTILKNKDVILLVKYTQTIIVKENAIEYKTPQSNEVLPAGRIMFFYDWRFNRVDDLIMTVIPSTRDGKTLYVMHPKDWSYRAFYFLNRGTCAVRPISINFYNVILHFTDGVYELIVPYSVTINDVLRAYTVDDLPEGVRAKKIEELKMPKEILMNSTLDWKFDRENNRKIYIKAEWMGWSISFYMTMKKVAMRNVYNDGDSVFLSFDEWNALVEDGIDDVIDYVLIS